MIFRRKEAQQKHFNDGGEIDKIMVATGKR